MWVTTVPRCLPARVHKRAHTHAHGEWEIAFAHLDIRQTFPSTVLGTEDRRVNKTSDLLMRSSQGVQADRYKQIIIAHMTSTNTLRIHSVSAPSCVLGIDLKDKTKVWAGRPAGGGSRGGGAGVFALLLWCGAGCHLPAEGPTGRVLSARGGSSPRWNET